MCATNILSFPRVQSEILPLRVLPDNDNVPESSESFLQDNKARQKNPHVRKSVICALMLFFLGQTNKKNLFILFEI